MNARVLIALACWCAAFAASAGVAAPETTNAGALTREVLLAELSRDLVAHYNLDGELSLDLVRPWSAPAQVASAWNLTVLDYPAAVTSTMVLRCRVSADGAVLGESTLVVRAALWRDVWMTRAPLTINSTFDPALLETRRVDLLRDRDALPATVGDRSYIFARGVAAGHMLTWRDVARRPLVKKGDTVQVSAVDGMLVVTMKAVAMQSGAQGETVTVRNPDSRKDFSALVVDENRVQVRF